MNNFSNWNNAIAELESARCMFNNAVTPHHTDIAIKAINLAEEKLELLKDAHKANYIPKQITPQVKDTLARKIVKRVLGVVYDVE